MSSVRDSRRKNEVFYSLALNKGSEWSENVTSDKAFFPRLKESCHDGDEEEDHVAALESMWMVGFLHHGKTADDNLVRSMNETSFCRNFDGHGHYHH